MIPTLPLRARNRLAETVLTALGQAGARRALAHLAEDGAAARTWLGDDDPRHEALLRSRARGAADALASLPLLTAPALDDTLAAAAALFDAGLGFEVHELIEPHWAAAAGGQKNVLQGLIQVAVGYQHLANGNVDGGRALLTEGADRMAAGQLDGFPLDRFVHDVRESLRRVEAGAEVSRPRFPRRP